MIREAVKEFLEEYDMTVNSFNYLPWQNFDLNRLSSFYLSGSYKNGIIDTSLFGRLKSYIGKDGKELIVDFPDKQAVYCAEYIENSEHKRNENRYQIDILSNTRLSIKLLSQI